MKLELMKHQLDAIENLSSGKVLYGGVGTGKSATVMGYYMKKQAPKPIYVITTAKKRDELDWEKEAAHYGIGTDTNVPGVGRIKIDSWNNIGNYIGIEDAFFIFDEQRVVGNGAWVKAFYKITKRNDWLLLSATPGDTWIDYIPLFVANGLYRNATEFKREHVVYAPYSRYPRIVKYIGVPTLEKYRNMLLVEMPFISHTHRTLEDIECLYDVEKYRQASVYRWHPYENRPIRDSAELFRLLRQIVNSDESRLHTLRTLMEFHPKLIVFYNFNYELDILRTLADEVTIAEWNGHKHEEIPKTDRWVFLVQYVAGAEGWNCIETDAMVFYSLTRSYKNFMQAQGRIDRLNTKFYELFYYIFVSNSSIDKANRKSLAEKRNFNERKWGVQALGIRDEFGVFPTDSKEAEKLAQKYENF